MVCNLWYRSNIVKANRLFNSLPILIRKRSQNPFRPNHLKRKSSVIIRITISKSTPSTILGESSHIMQECCAAEQHGIMGGQRFSLRYQRSISDNMTGMNPLQLYVADTFRIQVPIPIDILLEPGIKNSHVGSSALLVSCAFYHNRLKRYQRLVEYSGRH